MDQKQLVDELFELFDKNRDGSISRGEFIDLIDCLLSEKGQHVSRDIFDKFDKNHDNSISKEELHTLIQDMWL